MAQEGRSRKLQVGVIGGGFGRNHIRAYGVCDGVVVAAFCQRNRASAEKIAREFGIPHVFTDYRELLAFEDLDAVSIAAPVYLHYPMAIEALDRGIHVLSEKPLAMNREEAATMLTRAEQAGLIHMTAFNFRFIPALRRIKELLEEGYAGSRLFHVEAIWFAERRADPNAPLDWRHRRDRAGVGSLGDTGVHLIDLVRWLIGDFTKVCAHAATFTKERPLPDGSGKEKVTVEDSCLLMAELAHGVQASVHASGVAVGGVYQRIEISGSDGMLRLEMNRRDPDWVIGKLWGARRPARTLEPLPIPERLTQGLDLTHPDRAPAEFIFSHLTRRFAEGIRTGKPAAPSFRDGLEAQKVVDAAVQSAERECWVAVV